MVPRTGKGGKNRWQGECVKPLFKSGTKQKAKADTVKVMGKKQKPGGVLRDLARGRIVVLKTQISLEKKRERRGTNVEWT